MRRVIIYFLLALCFAGGAAVAQTDGLVNDIIVAPDGTYRTIDAFDSRQRPGHLIVYTPDFGSATATVDAVVEMIVVDGKVTELRRFGFNNTPIPNDGYVVSGHGAAADWLRFNFRTGDPAEIRRYEVTGDGKTAMRRINQTGPNVSRGADQLVVFTPGRDRTGTNPWGLEAVVRNDIVIAVGGNDNVIPDDGYVLSAHGDAKDWLTDNVQVGSAVTLRDGTAIVTYDSRSLTFQAETYLGRAAAGRAKAAEHGIMLPDADAAGWQASAEQSLYDARVFHEQGAVEKALQAAAESLANARKAAMAAQPAYSTGVRGVWYRHQELTPDHVVATLDRLEKVGINTVFLEVFYQGRTLYPSDIALQHPDYRRWDPLAVWTEEAKRRGIDLHLWVHAFRFGEYPVGPILSRNPEWMASGPQTDVPEMLQANRYSVDPAHPEARAFVLGLLQEMITRYDVAGLHLDYIRYPKRDSNLSLPSVTDYSRRVYKEETGIDPLQWVNQTDSAEWYRWQLWQEQQIASFVADTREMVNTVRPDIVLSASVMGELGEARYVTRQNWGQWADEGYVTLLIPMAYNTDSVWVGRAMEAARERVGGKALVTAGVGVYLGLTPEIVVDQILASEAAGSFGAALYALATLDGEHFAALTPGLYAGAAVPPYRTTEALHTLGQELASSLAITGGTEALEETAFMLQAYGTDRSASLHTLQLSLNRSLQPGEGATLWQAGLLSRAHDIVSIALHSPHGEGANR